MYLKVDNEREIRNSIEKIREVASLETCGLSDNTKEWFKVLGHLKLIDFEAEMIIAEMNCMHSRNLTKKMQDSIVKHVNFILLVRSIIVEDMNGETELTDDEIWKAEHWLNWFTTYSNNIIKVLPESKTKTSENNKPEALEAPTAEPLPRPANLPADMPWNGDPDFDPSEAFNPYVYDGNMAPDDYDLMHEHMEAAESNPDMDEEIPPCPPQFCGTCLPADCIHNQHEAGQDDLKASPAHDEPKAVNELLLMKEHIEDCYETAVIDTVQCYVLSLILNFIMVSPVCMVR